MHSPCPLAATLAQLVKDLNDAILVDIFVRDVHSVGGGDDERPKAKVQTFGALECHVLKYVQRVSAWAR